MLLVVGVGVGVVVVVVLSFAGDEGALTPSQKGPACSTAFKQLGSGKLNDERSPTWFPAWQTRPPTSLDPSP